MLVKLAFVMQKLKKIHEKIFVMINRDGGHSCYEGGHRAHGGPPVPPLVKTLVSDIHLKIAANGHAHKLYPPRWVKELQTR